MTRFAVVLAAALAFGPAAAEPARPQIAIIIDDLGYQQRAGERAIALPGPVAYAILPGTPRAAVLASAAQMSQKEVLLHLPMQASDPPRRAEPGMLSLGMDRADVAAALDAALADVPQAIGVSNHRGSLLTQQDAHMQWLMEALGARERLFFVDSYTTHKSIALHAARGNGVQAVRRDVFLDDDPSTDRIRDEFERLKRIARERGAAIAIGHPYETTLGFLETALPALADEGFELVPISVLVTNPAAFAYSKSMTGPAGPGITEMLDD